MGFSIWHWVFVPFLLLGLAVALVVWLVRRARRAPPASAAAKTEAAPRLRR